MTPIHTPSRIRELAARSADGMDVALLWNADTDTVSVSVHDSKTGDAFELVLGDSDRALDVFEHPYAYAAHRGVDFDIPSRLDEMPLAA